jgi:prophage maintenance system killer protein
LRLNGLFLQTTEVEAAAVFLELAAGNIGEEELANWFSRNSTEL